MKRITLKLRQIDSLYYYSIKDPDDDKRFRIKHIGTSSDIDEILSLVRREFVKEEETREG